MHISTEENRLMRCKCGKRLLRHKMQSINNELLCSKCAGVAITRNKRLARQADNYQVAVVLLDGTRLFYQPMEVST